ncbi:dihydroneopterin aldolase [Brevundimonas sp.]|uniref:dihydroneopterin aldolase n=1 Tax=Brevundimonas sp. TaxID=1871086 RepID=UPI0035B47EB4
MSATMTGLGVFVRGLELQAGIGVHAHEHGRLQTLVVDIELTLAPGAIGGLDETVNYEGVVAAARDIVAAGHIELVETFAERLGRVLLEHPRARAVRVRVEKPGALGDHAVPGCEVRLESAG